MNEIYETERLSCEQPKVQGTTTYTSQKRNTIEYICRN